MFTFLGTSGYHPSESRHTAGVVVPGANLLLDAGTGTFRLAEVLGTGPGDERPLDIVLSHAHLDHIIGLTYFIPWLVEKRFSAVRLHARAEVHDAIETHLFSEQIFPIRLPFERVEIDGGDELELANGHRLTCWHQPHRGVTLGMRIEGGGKSFCYCTDVVARPGEDVEPIRGADTLIHECHFNDSHVHMCEQTGHSNLSAVAARAAEAEVGRLFLTHINPHYPTDPPLDLAPAKAVFEKVMLAEDLMHVSW